MTIEVNELNAFIRMTPGGKIVMLDNELMRRATKHRIGHNPEKARFVMGLLEAVAEELGDARDDNGDLYSERVLKLEIWDD